MAHNGAFALFHGDRIGMRYAISFHRLMTRLHLQHGRESICGGRPKDGMMKEDIFLGCQRERDREKARQAFIATRHLYPGLAFSLLADRIAAGDEGFCTNMNYMSMNKDQQ